MRVLLCPRERVVAGLWPHDRKLFAQRRDGTALQQVELVTLARTFDVDRPAHRALQLLGQSRDRDDRVVGDRIAVRGATLEDREIAFAEPERVRCDRPRCNGIPESTCGIHDDDLARAAHRIRAEGDRGDIRVDHDLDQDSHARGLGHAALTPVGDRTRRRHRSPAVEHGVHDLGRARDIEDALVLARERRVAGVLADRRRADGHARTRIPDPSAELRVRSRDQLVQLGIR